MSTIPISDTQLEVLKSFDRENNHITGEKLHGFAWDEAGCPCMWNVVERQGSITVAIDSGYGFMAAFDNNRLIDVKDTK